MSTTTTNKGIQFIAKVARFNKDRKVICIPIALNEYMDQTFGNKSVKITIENIL